MGDRKRSSPTIVTMNEASPNGTSISKKRKITASASHLHHQSIPSVTSANSAATVSSDEFCSDHTPLPRFSSSKVMETCNVVKERDSTSLDPEVCFYEFWFLKMNFRFRILQYFFCHNLFFWIPNTSFAMLSFF